MSAETIERRSAIMRAVKGKDTKPEMIVRRMVHALGGRFRLNRRDLPGSPDLVFPGRRKVVFVHGCFWHGHECPRGARVPKSNQDYWMRKIARNRERDSRAMAELKEMEWAAAVVWECELREPEAVRRKLREFLEL